MSIDTTKMDCLSVGSFGIFIDDVRRRGYDLENVLTQTAHEPPVPHGFDVLASGLASSVHQALETERQDKINSATKNFLDTTESLFNYARTHSADISVTAVFYTDASHADYPYRIEFGGGLAAYLGFQYGIVKYGEQVLRTRILKDRCYEEADHSWNPFQGSERGATVVGIGTKNRNFRNFPYYSNEEWHGGSVHQGNITESEFKASVESLKEMEEKLPIRFTWRHEVSAKEGAR